MQKLIENLGDNQANVSRRHFMKSSVGLGLILGLGGMNAFALAADPAPLKVVVVGGGFAGATAAKYLKIWGKSAVDVTLIEASEKFTSPILSGLVVTSQLAINRLDFGFDRLEAHGITVVQNTVTAVDSVAKTVTLSDNATTVTYDRLILAPGIDFVPVDGWDPLKLPHAWAGRDQLALFTEQLANFPENGTVVIRVPVGPYRCPPGPYERASTIADFLRVTKKNARVIVLDNQPDITIDPELFHELYEEFGVEYRPNIRVKRVNSGDDTGNGRSITFVELETDAEGLVTAIEGEEETIEAAVINLIPAHKAAKIIFDAGLTIDEGNWAPVDPLTYASTVPGKEFIHILGDSQGTAQTKAGQAANGQAKICADAILQQLAGKAVYGQPIVTVGCSALVTQTRANWAGNTWHYDPETKSMFKFTGNAAADPSPENQDTMFKWANNLFADTFG